MEEITAVKENANRRRVVDCVRNHQIRMRKILGQTGDSTIHLSLVPMPSSLPSPSSSLVDALLALMMSTASRPTANGRKQEKGGGGGGLVVSGDPDHDCGDDPEFAFAFITH